MGDGRGKGGECEGEGKVGTSSSRSLSKDSIREHIRGNYMMLHLRSAIRGHKQVVPARGKQPRFCVRNIQ